MSCSLFNLLAPKRKYTKARRTATIEIRSSATQVWRAAILSTDPNSDRNVISQKLVTKVLGEPIHSADKEAAKPMGGGHEQQVEGYVDLDWCLEKNSKMIHRTRFLVSSTYNPPYDAVLGKDDALQYGMLKQKSKGRN